MCSPLFLCLSLSCNLNLLPVFPPPYKSIAIQQLETWSLVLSCVILSRGSLMVLCHNLAKCLGFENNRLCIFIWSRLNVFFRQYTNSNKKVIGFNDTNFLTDAHRVCRRD